MKKCKACKQPFTPTQPLQKACGWECALVLAKKLVEQADKVKQREAKDRIKTKAAWRREAQSAFNAWIRHRDRLLPCISCGRDHNGQWHAGHYRSAGGHPEISMGDPSDPTQQKIAERNVNRQCAPCNTYKSGSVVDYRINLLRKIGPDAMEILEGPHDPRHWTIEDFKRIKAHYKNKLKEARNGLHSCNENPAGGQAGNQTAMEPAPETLPGVRDHS